MGWKSAENVQERCDNAQQQVVTLSIWFEIMALVSRTPFSFSKKTIEITSGLTPAGYHEAPGKHSRWHHQDRVSVAQFFSQTLSLQLGFSLAALTYHFLSSLSRLDAAVFQVCLSLLYPYYCRSSPSLSPGHLL